jgi:hypothetical protein
VQRSQPELPPDTDLNDFDYLAVRLEAEIVTDAAYGYVSLDAIRFYLGQMRRVYQQAAVSSANQDNATLDPLNKD